MQNGDFVITYEADDIAGSLPIDAEFRWDLNGDGVFDVTGPYARVRKSTQRSVAAR